MSLQTLVSLLTILVLVVMLIRLVLKIKKRKPEQKPLTLMVISQCKSCNDKEWTSIFKEGDYLLKPCGKCICGKTLRIVKIYNEAETKAERKWRAYTKRFDV